MSISDDRLDYTPGDIDRLTLRLEMERIRLMNNDDTEDEQAMLMIEQEAQELLRQGSPTAEGGKSVSGNKRQKEETGTEKWERIKEEKERKENKKAKINAKKMKKEGKMRPITAYFN
jgi:hypothetical protein